LREEEFDSRSEGVCEEDEEGGEGWVGGLEEVDEGENGGVPGVEEVVSD
jgi:hypothetical protein